MSYLYMCILCTYVGTYISMSWITDVCKVMDVGWMSGARSAAHVRSFAGCRFLLSLLSLHCILSSIPTDLTAGNTEDRYGYWFSVRLGFGTFSALQHQYQPPLVPGLSSPVTCYRLAQVRQILVGILPSSSWNSDNTSLSKHNG